MIKDAKPGDRVILLETGESDTILRVTKKARTLFIRLENIPGIFNPKHLKRDHSPEYTVKATSGKWTLFRDDDGIMLTTEKKIADYVLKNIHQILGERGNSLSERSR